MERWNGSREKLLSKQFRRDIKKKKSTSRYDDGLSAIKSIYEDFKVDFKVYWRILLGDFVQNNKMENNNESLNIVI